MDKKKIANKQSSDMEQIYGVPVRKTPETSKTKRYGLWIIIIFIGGFILWSTLAPLESAALAPGKVVSSGYRRVIQHLDGGIVSHIYVKDGSRVKKSQILMQLDDDQAKLSVILLENQVLELSANRARLVAEKNDAERITFPERILENSHKKAVANIISNQESLFTANRDTYHNQLKILTQRIEQIRFQIKGIEAQLKSNKKQYELIVREAKEVEALYKKRLIELSRLLALHREKARLIGDRGQQIASLAQLQQKIGETKHEIIALKSTRSKEILEQLLQTHQKLVEALKKEKTAQSILARTSIRSPQEGIVVGLKIHTIGGVVKSGEPIMDIVPTKEALIVEARVSPLDIDIVHAGLLAKIELSAFKSRTTPLLIGKVTNVSADAFQDEENGTSYYLARVEIDKKELARLKKGQTLYPGMPVIVMIVTGKQTFLEYIFTPVKDSFNRAFREQ